MSRRKGKKATNVGRAAEASRLAVVELSSTPGEVINLIEYERRVSELLSDPVPYGSEADRLKDVCRICGQVGHWGSDCTNLKCHICGEWGHRRSMCPTKAES